MLEHREIKMAALNEKNSNTQHIDDVEGLRRVEGTIDGHRLAALKGDGLVKSRFDSQPIWKTMWMFRVSACYCFLVFTGLNLDGFEVNTACVALNDVSR